MAKKRKKASKKLKKIPRVYEAPVPNLGSPIILCSCKQGKERFCEDEMMLQLKRLSNRMFPRKKFRKKRSGGADSSDGEAEVARADKSGNEERIVLWKLPPELRGLCIICVKDRRINPVKLVCAFMESCIEGGHPPTDFTFHLVPLQSTCMASQPAIRKLVRNLIRQAGPLHKDLTCDAVIRRRLSNKLSNSVVKYDIRNEIHSTEEHSSTAAAPRDTHAPM
eukprot:644091_1